MRWKHQRSHKDITLWRRRFAWRPLRDPDTDTSYWLEHVWYRLVVCPEKTNHHVCKHRQPHCSLFYNKATGLYILGRFEYRGGRDAPEVKAQP